MTGGRAYSRVQHVTKRAKANGNSKETSSDRQREPTERERAAIEAIKSHEMANPPLRVRVSADGLLIGVSEHPFNLELLRDSVGGWDRNFFNGLIKQSVDVASQDQQVDEEKLNFMLAVIIGFKPKDQQESMLAAQMAAIHWETMICAKRLANAHGIEERESAERALNRLARTYPMQMEALKRYRSGGEQKVTVQHVSVSGGQAIVGNVTQAPKASSHQEGAAKSKALTPPMDSPMSIIEDKKERAVLPRRSKAKKEAKKEAKK
jgi:hypothetical protein